MKHAIRVSAAAICFLFVASVAANAQVPYTEGAVERVVLLNVLPGHFDAFMADFKKNVIPIWDAQKSSGLIVDYQIFLNETRASTDDWNVGFSLIYKSMASLDGLPDKIYELRMKQYGSRDAEQKVIDKRVENYRPVTSYLLRDIKLR